MVRRSKVISIPPACRFDRAVWLGDALGITVSLGLYVQANALGSLVIAGPPIFEHILNLFDIPTLKYGGLLGGMELDDVFLYGPPPLHSGPWIDRLVTAWCQRFGGEEITIRYPPLLKPPTAQ